MEYYKAIVSNDVVRMRQLLEDKADPDRVLNGVYINPLTLVCKCDGVKAMNVIKLLLEYKAQVNPPFFPPDDSPLINAIKHRVDSNIDILLDHGAINEYSSYAVANASHTDIFIKLMDCGATYKAKSKTDQRFSWGMSEEFYQLALDGYSRPLWTPSSHTTRYTSTREREQIYTVMLIHTIDKEGNYYLGAISNEIFFQIFALMIDVRIVTARRRYHTDDEPFFK